MNETIIRSMTSADLDAVTAIEAETFPIPWSRESFRQELERNVAARYLVAEKEGRVIGYAGAWIILDESHITNIAITPSERGKGTGRKLTEALLQLLSNLGASYATLEVRESNLRAQGLYRSLGFIRVGRRKRYYEDNQEDAFLMVCDHLPDADPYFEDERTVRE